MTAVSWLKDMLEWNYGDPQMLEISWENLDDLLERAKQMEKEQIIEAFDCDGTPQPGEVWISNGELYYNETYNK